MNNFISVIIPVFNDPKGLQDTVNSLISQITNKSYEIIIVDNNSTDNTATIAKLLSNKSPEKVFLHNEKNIQSSYAARNLGIIKSRGGIFCFIDADMTVGSDYINKVFNFFSAKDVEYVGCNVKLHTTVTSLAAKYNVATGFPIETYIKKSHFCPTCSLCIRRNLIEKIGYFDERLISGGDWEFGNRAYKRGIIQVFASEITLLHPARTTFNSLTEKAKRIGRGLGQLAYYHPEYSYKVTNHYSPRYYIPNARRIIKSFKKSNYTLNKKELIIVILFVVYSRFMKFIYIMKEVKRLKKKQPSCS